MTFLIEKTKLVSFTLFLDASPPPRPKMPFLDNDMPLFTYTTYVKGVLGLGGGQGVVSAKEDNKHLTKWTTSQNGHLICTSTV